MIQLGSMWSILCNIQHLPQQQSQQMIQCSLVRNRIFCHCRQPNTATWESYPNGNKVKRIMIQLDSTQETSEPWEHCAAYNLKRSFWQRIEPRHTCDATKKKSKESRIISKEGQLWQESQFKKQRQRLCKSRKLWDMLKRRDWQLQN